MEQFLQNLLQNNNIPLVTAFILGLLTAISPCPLATNITAIGYIGKDIENRKRIFSNGLLYTLGRIVSYTLLGVVLILILKSGSSLYGVQKFIARYGEMIIGPALLLIGLFMLFGRSLNLPKFGFSGQQTEKYKQKGSWGAFMLGILFALAFCPTSSVFYFGMLIPMSAAKTGGYFLPVIFAFATALPIIVVAWILAYSISGIGKFYTGMQKFEKWLSMFVAVIFIGVGIYYTLRIIF
ncbi:MAG: aromatic aminobenezylarsenical efflux permease ArsG family transporter [Petrimonas sp.]|nr:aromatic aminobenezylarsenical efflux permease ArsG family transporter [Petrimonas sp.]